MAKNRSTIDVDAAFMRAIVAEFPAPPRKAKPKTPPKAPPRTAKAPSAPQGVSSFLAPLLHTPRAKKCEETFISPDGEYGSDGHDTPHIWHLGCEDEGCERIE
jgi:hypothetical protein